jgi:hypothetical protein
MFKICYHSGWGACMHRAYVRWAALGVTPQTRAFVSLAGPLAGGIGAAVCALLWKETGDAFWIGLAGLAALSYLIDLAPPPPSGS